MSGSATLLGGELLAEPQVAPGGSTAGSMSTLYAGTVGTQVTPGLIRFPGSGAATANNATGLFSLPLQLNPAAGGASGTGPGNYGVKFSTPVDIDIPPIDLSPFGIDATLDLGTLESVDLNVAIRDLQLQLDSSGPIPFDPYATLPQTFDASSLDFAVTGDIDLNLSAVTKTDNLLGYFANLAALTLLRQALLDQGIDLSVVGNLGNLTISIGTGFGTTFPTALAANDPSSLGLFEQVGSNFRLTVPVDFEIVPEIPPEFAAILDAQFAFQGQLVAQAPVQILVPEPSTLMLAGLGLLGSVPYLRRRMR